MTAAIADLSFGVTSAAMVRGVALAEAAIDVHAAISHAGESGWRASAGVMALHAKAAPRRLV